MKIKAISVQIASVVASFILFASVPLLYAWTGPASTPPGGNVGAPVNISSASQNKTGVLGLGGLAVFGKSLFTNTSGYSLPSSNPNMLIGVNGLIGAKGYCDENGNNCVTTLGGSNITVNNNGGSGRSVVCQIRLSVCIQYMGLRICCPSMPKRIQCHQNF
jgi:hypothetical protein